VCNINAGDGVLILMWWEVGLRDLMKIGDWKRNLFED